MKNFLLNIIIVIPLIGSGLDRNCPSCSVHQDTLIYKRIKCGLFLSNKGDIAFQTQMLLNENGEMGIRYINWIYDADTTDTLNAELVEMKYVIDTSSFKFLSNIYWRDKNKVYGFNPMSDGGTVYYLFLADPHSFKALEESPYAKDKNNVYYKGDILKEADVNTFKIIKQYLN